MQLKNLRVFLGLPLSASLADALDQCRRQNEHLPGIRWVHKENLHLTVCFIGNIPAEELAVKVTGIKNALKDAPGFTLTFEKFCVAPPRKPRMAWAQFEENEQFAAMLVKTHAMLIPGQPVRHRPIPHVTLGRFRNPASCKSIVTDIPVPEGKIEDREWVLWQSVKEEGKMKYIPLERFLLNIGSPSLRSG